MPTGIWFYWGVELNLMKLYSLAVNERVVCSVEVESPAWLPVRPRVPKTWLASVVSRALLLNDYFAPQPTYLGWYDRSTSSPFLN